MCLTFPDRWVKPCHTDFTETHAQSHHRGIEILISQHSRHSGLSGLRLWISLWKCSITAYGTLSRWVPFRAEKWNFYLGWNLQGQKAHRMWAFKAVTVYIFDCYRKFSLEDQGEEGPPCFLDGLHSFLTLWLMHSSGFWSRMGCPTLPQELQIALNANTTWTSWLALVAHWASR